MRHLLILLCFSYLQTDAIAQEKSDSEILKLVRTIDDQPDPLHPDYTPSVNKLIGKGLPAIPPVLELMMSDSPKTRMRAQRVLQGITSIQHGFVFGKGWTTTDGQMDWRALWARLGGLHWDDTSFNRQRSVALWKKWLAEMK